jgi:protein Xni
VHQDNIDNIADSCSHSLARALGFHRPSHCIAVFEQHGNTWRHEVLPQYKKDRSPMPVLLQETMPTILSRFQESGVKSMERPGYEADDLIATFARGVSQNNGNTVILTTDRIQCQLLSPNIRVYDHFSERFLDEAAIFDKFGVEPGLIPDVMALAGDSSLSIQGVKSVGIKTAARLVNEYGSLAAVFKSIDSVKGSIANHLNEDRHQAELAYKLFCLKSDISLGVNLKDFRVDHTT